MSNAIGLFEYWLDKGAGVYDFMCIFMAHETQF